MIQKVKNLTKSKTAKHLASNALMLYLLTFSNYILYLITIPYQTRVLGPELFGQVNFAVSFALYFQIIIEFGFMIFGTEVASKQRDDRQKLSQLLSTVMACRAILTLASAVALLILCLIAKPFNTDPLLYILFFVSSVFAAMMPDFIYRGMENMKTITVRTVIIRAFFMLSMILLLTQKEQYHMVAVLTLLGNMAAFAFSVFDLRKKGVVLVRTNSQAVRQMFAKSMPFFLSRVATNIYSASNIFIVGLIYGANSKITGFYASTDRLVAAGKNVLVPVIDTTYPYMVKHRNFQLIKKLLLIAMPPLTVGCIVVAIFAENIAALLFGDGYTQAGQYLQLLMPIVWVAFPAMLLGFPTMTPMGLASYANRSNVYGAILHLIQLAVLFLMGSLTVITICIATIITEVFTFLYRAWVVYKYRSRMYES